MKTDERKALDAYLGKNIRKVAPTSSLLQSTSRWLNHAKIRELVAVWMLRRNGPDFPVEADHTLGMSPAFAEVLPDAEVALLLEHERAINPELDAWFNQGFVSTYRNDDFLKYPAGTVGGLIGHQIRHHGFDLTLGMGDTIPESLTPLQYWRLRSRQAHDFEHIISGGQFNSLGEVAVTFARSANQSQHLSPELASAFNAYMMFAGLRMVTRSLLHYPETWVSTLRCLEQGIHVGLASPPFWYFRWEDVFELTPTEARRHFGVPEVDNVDTEHESAIFSRGCGRSGASRRMTDDPGSDILFAIEGGGRLDHAQSARPAQCDDPADAGRDSATAVARGRRRRARGAGHGRGPGILFGRGAWRRCRRKWQARSRRYCRAVLQSDGARICRVAAADRDRGQWPGGRRRCLDRAVGRHHRRREIILPAVRVCQYRARARRRRHLARGHCAGPGQGDGACAAGRETAGRRGPCRRPGHARGRR